VQLYSTAVVTILVLHSTTQHSMACVQFLSPWRLQQGTNPGYSTRCTNSAPLWWPSLSRIAQHSTEQHHTAQHDTAWQLQLG
jgi:hypothetical protein